MQYLVCKRETLERRVSELGLSRLILRLIRAGTENGVAMLSEFLEEVLI